MRQATRPNRHPTEWPDHGHADRHPQPRHPHRGAARPDRRQAHLPGRQDRRRRQPARLVPCHRARRPRRDGGSLVRKHPRHLRERRQARLLSLARVPHRPPARRRPRQPGPHRGRPRRPRPGRRRPRGPARGGAGCRPRQWRPRPPRRLLPGQHGHPRRRRLRLRHPLRARPVPPGDPRRRPAGAAGGMAPLRQPLGVRTPRGRLPRRLRRHRRRRPAARRHHHLHLEPRRDPLRGRLRHARHRCPAPRAHARPPRQHPAPLVRPRRHAPAPRGVQPRRPRRRPPGEGPHRGRLPRAVSRRR